MASVIRASLCSALLNLLVRCACWYCRGLMPTIFLNIRWKWNGLRPTRREMASRLSVVSRFSSIKRRAASTFCTCRLRSSGVHRRQGRYPALRACSGESKNSTFSGRGRRLGHEGRQKMPVDLTAYTNWPSALMSRDRTCVHFSSFKLFELFELFELLKVCILSSPLTILGKRGEEGTPC